MPTNYSTVIKNTQLAIANAHDSIQELQDALEQDYLNLDVLTEQLYKLIELQDIQNINKVK